MFRSFFGMEGRVGTSHEDRHAPLSEGVCDLVTTERCDRPDRDSNHIHIGVKINLLRRVVDQRYRPVFRGKSGEVRNDRTYQLPLPQLVRDSGTSITIARRLYDEESWHRGKPLLRQMCNLHTGIRLCNLFRSSSGKQEISSPYYISRAVSLAIAEHKG